MSEPVAAVVSAAEGKKNGLTSPAEVKGGDSLSEGKGGGLVVERTLLLRGHNSAVSCVEAGPSSETADLLLSGSQDSSMRLWDLRTGKPTRCMRCFAAEEPPDNVCFSNRAHQLVYGAAGRVVYEFDLRRQDVLLRRADRSFACNAEEISQLAMAPSDAWLAAADDSGAVQLIGLTDQQRPSQVLAGAHDCLCGAVAVHPNGRLVLTGGMDCRLALWDALSGKLLSALETNRTSPAEAAAAAQAQVLNPPFPLTVRFSRRGEQVLVALGDGSVRVYSQQPRAGLAELGRLQLHAAPAACLALAQWHPDTLATCGNDRLVTLTDLPAAVRVWERQHRRAAKNKQQAQKKKSKSKRNAGEKTNRMEDLAAEATPEPGSDTPALMLRFMHHEKPNWLATGKKSSLIIIADPTPQVLALNLQKHPLDRQGRPLYALYSDAHYASDRETVVAAINPCDV
eukprot:g10114.t1